MLVCTRPEHSLYIESTKGPLFSLSIVANSRRCSTTRVLVDLNKYLSSRWVLVVLQVVPLWSTCLPLSLFSTIISRSWNKLVATLTPYLRVLTCNTPRFISASRHYFYPLPNTIFVCITSLISWRKNPIKITVLHNQIYTVKCKISCAIFYLKIFFFSRKKNRKNKIL